MVNRPRLTSLLLNPSLLSFFISTFGAAIILVIANWSYITPKNMLYDYLFGSYGIATVLQNSSNALSAMSSIFESPFAYNIAVAIFAVFIGLFVYVFLEGLDHIAAEATGKIDGINYINDETEKHVAKKTMEIRLGLRAITLVVWLCYILFFLKIVVPYSILLGRIDVSRLLSWPSMWHGLTAFLLLSVSIHVHVILLRLLVLRPRLFGIQNVLIGRGGHDD